MNVGIPELDWKFNPLTWCPMMIKLKENSQFSWTGAPPTGQDGNLISALNTEEYRGSLKEAYGGKSMSLTIHSNLRKLQSADQAMLKPQLRGLEESQDNQLEEEDQGFNLEELKLME